MRATDVVGAARRKRDDPAYRPRRIAFRPSDARQSRQRGRACGQMQKISAGKFHFKPPSRFTSAEFLLLSQCGELPEETGSRVERRSSFPERQSERDREYLR
jgi:hypothetical protein